MISLKDFILMFVFITLTRSEAEKSDDSDFEEIRFIGDVKGTNPDTDAEDATPDDDKGSAREACRTPPELLSRQCCIFPPFFMGKIASECGAKAILNFNKQNITAISRFLTNNDCDHWRCVLMKYKQITKKDYVDVDKYFKHLDKWANLNPKFKAVISEGKRHCNMVFRMTFPIHICRFTYFNTCMRNFIKLDCPQLIPEPICYEQKKIFQDCRQFLI